jgi:FtsH-binding integral membrane protein
MNDLQSRTIQSSGTSLASKTFLLLALSMMVSAGGAWVGFGLGTHPFILIACVIAQLVGIFVLRAVRENTSMGLLVLAGWMALSGITTGVVVNQYIAILGVSTVVGAFLGTVGVMALCGVIATFSGIDFKPLQKFLFIGLLGLIVVGVVGWFVHFNTVINLVYSGIGMAVFAAFFLVDFYRLAKSQDNSWGEAISLTLSIYLDFVNFFLDLLRFLGALKRR